MDSFWQQHRSFILKILAGLFVGLVCWIIGASLNETSLSERVEGAESVAEALAAERSPTPDQLREYEAAVVSLERQSVNLARSLGITGRFGEEDPETAFRKEVIGRILIGIEPGIEDRPDAFGRKLEEHLSKARSNPSGCLSGLRASARKYLQTEANSRDVEIDAGLGIVGRNPDPEELDRYLVGLSLVVKVVGLAMEEGLHVISDIRFEKPTEIRAEAGDSDDVEILRVGTRYPVKFSVTGSSADLLRFLARLVEPAPGLGSGGGDPGRDAEPPIGMMAFRELGSWTRSNLARRDDEDLMDFEFVVAVLRFEKVLAKEE